MAQNLLQPYSTSKKPGKPHDRNNVQLPRSTVQFFPMALAAYRNLLRAAKIAFEGDARILTAARQEIRTKFREQAALPLSDASVEPAIAHANEVAGFLRTNVVQGRHEKDGLYRLRIHEETERGDNDTVKLGNQTIKIDGKTCADR